jgi:hypothetical protein
MLVEEKIKLLKALYKENITDYDILNKLSFLYEENDQNILDQLSRKQRVRFALRCVRSVQHLIKFDEELNQKTSVCLDLLDQWLSNPKSVSKQQLRDAGCDAHYIAYTAANTAFAAVNYAAANTAYYVANTASNKQQQIKLNRSFLIETILET